MELASSRSENLGFLLKSTMNVSIISAISVAPFAIYCLWVSKTVLGFVAFAAFIISMYNIYSCYKGNYQVKLNLFALLPFISASAFIGLYEWGVMGSFWSYPMILVCYFVLPFHIARIANLVLLLLMLPFAWIHLETEVFVRFYVVLIGISLFAHLTLKEIYRQHSELHRLSVTDVLTGLYNRFLINSSLQSAVELYKREKTPMSILMLDLDHFKQVNDKFGHEAGDEVLKGVANIMKNDLRKTDMLFRLGGEEFLVLLRGANLQVATGLAEKIRNKVEKSVLLVNYEITVSLGVSELSSVQTWKEWVNDCDKNLYSAKRKGRNNVVAG